MNYGIFARMSAGEWPRMDRESDQAYMERALTQVCAASAPGEGAIINDLLMPAFVECDARDASLALAFKVEGWMCNPSGRLHGGILTTCVDMTMGVLTRFLRGGKAVATVDLHVNFLRPVPKGSTFVIRAHVNKLGNRIVFLSGTGTVLPAMDECCAASGVFI